MCNIMRKNDLQSLITLLDVFEVITITDDDENEYVVLKSCGVTSIDNIDDKTAFEAVMNHTHIIDDVKKSNINDIEEFSNKLLNTYGNFLHYKYPSKHFVVYVTIDDSVTLRFHQKWSNEPWYYIVNEPVYDSTVLYFEC